jgi:hypothetical protein
MALVTFEEVKAALPYIEDTDETMVALLINEACARANRYTRRTLESKVHEEILDGNGKDFVVLSNWPVTDFDEVRLDLERQFGDDTIVDPGDYSVDTVNALVRFVYDLPDRPGCVKVKYTAGYVTVPYDLKGAIIDIVALLWKRRTGGGIGIKSQAGPDGLNTVYEEGLPWSAVQVLNQYRRILV